MQVEHSVLKDFANKEKTQDSEFVDWFVPKLHHLLPLLPEFVKFQSPPIFQDISVAVLDNQKDIFQKKSQKLVMLCQTHQ